MFQFPTFALLKAVIRVSRNQRLFDGSSRLFAAFHALLRLPTPRHPPCALSSLTTLVPATQAFTQSVHAFAAAYCRKKRFSFAIPRHSPEGDHLRDCNTARQACNHSLKSSGICNCKARCHASIHQIVRDQMHAAWRASHRSRPGLKQLSRPATKAKPGSFSSFGHSP